MSGTKIFLITSGIMALSVIICRCWNILSEPESSLSLQIINGILSLVFIGGLFGFCFFTTWLVFKLEFRGIELKQQGKLEEEKNKTLDKYSDKSETKFQKWKMESLLKLSELLKEKTVKEENGKTTVEKIDEETRTKLNEFFEKIITQKNESTNG